ncbi:alpha/beta hydrolase [Halogeometricum pallidum JCM 14848]|uniref:Alpha/beta hydrolase n=1 Tax=Halogeometricum pallidum JCM 14848 TaxID=1227487 RepID=M0CTD8_HALPD|nr:alpha/beta hydrolase [Halogeometricum pallidum]ELZ26495.1 alpha/beta hydrolase [Halogeometricum pallidum JCM 14848]
MSIYRSEAGRRALESAYEDAVARLDVDRRRVEARHGSTHVLLAGPEDGRPAFAFHGGNATNPMTLSWYAGLAEQYRLIAPDTIGQPGLSAEVRVPPRGDGYGEWVVDLLDAFDVRSAPMVGTSYGAGIVLRTATHAPDRIDRAALVVPAGFGTGPLPSLLRVGLPAVLYRFLPAEWLLNRVLAAMATESDPDPLVRDTVAASLRHVVLEREFPEADAADLDGFDAPTALFVGENDPFFPPETVLPRARRRLRGLSLTEVLPGERHILSPAARESVTASIRAFFEG